MNDLTLFLVLQAAAFALLFIEIFLPSFGLLTACSLGALFASWQLASEVDPIFTQIFIWVDLIGFPAIGYYALRVLRTSALTNRTELTEADGFQSPKREIVAIGSRGIAQTDLRPFGQVEFEDGVHEVSTQGEWVEKGTEVEAIYEDTGTIYVIAKAQL